MGSRSDTPRGTSRRRRVRLDIDDGTGQGAGNSGNLLDGTTMNLPRSFDAIGLAAHNHVVGTGTFKGLQHAGHGTGREHNGFARANFGLNQDVRLNSHGGPFVSSPSILPDSPRVALILPEALADNATGSSSRSGNCSDRRRSRPRQLRRTLRLTLGAVGILGSPSRLKCDATRPSGLVTGFVTRRRFMEPENSDFTMVSSMTPQIDTQQIVTSSTQVDDDDHERFTHIVLEGYTPRMGSSSLWTTQSSAP